MRICEVGYVKRRRAETPDLEMNGRPHPPAADMGPARAHRLIRHEETSFRDFPPYSPLRIQAKVRFERRQARADR